MDPLSLPDFLLLPNPDGSAGGLLHVLEPTNDFTTDSFVLLPYNRPGDAVKPRFYRVTSKTGFSFSPGKTVTASLRLQARTSRETYREVFKQLKQHIQRGDIYEINYCLNFEAQSATIDPVDVFFRLQQFAPAPYAALLKTGDDYLLCASPELFLKKAGRVLSTKPIKGTVRRGKDQQEDKVLKEGLYNSLKERTENVMAVDVARNDLSQVAERGSVQVNRLYNIETFETVHQMVSTVSCQLRDGISFDQIVEATFPMASMTGAPKLRARQLSEQYENFERGLYSGAMGLVDGKGDFELAVIIRSIFYNQVSGKLSIAAGGAITHLSEADKEYDECLLKAAGMMKALNAVLE